MTVLENLELAMSGAKRLRGLMTTRLTGAERDRIDAVLAQVGLCVTTASFLVSTAEAGDSIRRNPRQRPFSSEPIGNVPTCPTRYG